QRIDPEARMPRDFRLSDAPPPRLHHRGLVLFLNDRSASGATPMGLLRLALGPLNVLPRDLVESTAFDAPHLEDALIRLGVCPYHRAGFLEDRRRAGHDLSIRERHRAFLGED